MSAVVRSPCIRAIPLPKKACRRGNNDLSENKTLIFTGVHGKCVHFTHCIRPLSVNFARLRTFYPRLYRHIGVCGAGSRFFRVLGERRDAYAGAPMNSVHGVDTGRLLATNDNETGKIGPSPAGCGENPLILRCRPRRWTRHSRRPPPRLSGFSLRNATYPYMSIQPREADLYGACFDST